MTFVAIKHGIITDRLHQGNECRQNVRISEFTFYFARMSSAKVREHSDTVQGAVMERNTGDRLPFGSAEDGQNRRHDPTRQQAVHRFRSIADLRCADGTSFSQQIPRHLAVQVGLGFTSTYASMICQPQILKILIFIIGLRMNLQKRPRIKRKGFIFWIWAGIYFTKEVDSCTCASPLWPC